MGACGTGKKGKEPLPVLVNIFAELDVPQKEGQVRIYHTNRK